MRMDVWYYSHIRQAIQQATQRGMTMSIRIKRILAEEYNNYSKSSLIYTKYLISTFGLLRSIEIRLQQQGVSKGLWIRRKWGDV